MALILFYITSAVAIFATVMMITRLNAVHGLLYLILSLLAVGVIFFLLGAHFAAVLEVIIYAGAIMVLFVFVIMMLNQGQKTIEQERAWLQPGIWIGPSVLALILFVELLVIVVLGGNAGTGHIVNSKQVGIALYGPYLLAVELASMLLLAGLVGAYHLGKPMLKSTRPGGEFMNGIPMELGLSLSAVLFVLGLIGVMVRRNLIMMLMSLEVMLNATGLAFIVAGSRWGQADGQIMFLLILTLAAAEVGVGLGLALQIFHRFRTLDADSVNEMQG